MYYKLEFDIAALFVLAILLIFYYPRKSFPSETNRLFRRLLLDSVLATTLDIISVVMMRHAEQCPMWSLHFVNIAFYLAQNAQACIFMLYMLSFVGDNSKLPGTKKGRSRIVMIPYLIDALIIISTPLTGMAFYFDENRMYHQGPALPVFYVVSFIYILGNTVILYRFRKEIVPRKKLAAYLFILTTAGAMGIQMLVGELLITNFASACSCIMIFMILQNPEETVDRETGLFTREAFISVLTDHVRQNDRVTVLLIAPDNLKSVGKVLGFDAFGLFIKAVGEYFGKEFNSTSYLIDRDCVGMIIDGVSETIRKQSIDTIKARFAEPWKLSGISISRTCSIGCVERKPGDSTEYELDLIKYTLTEMKRLQNDCLVIADGTEARSSRVDELEQQKQLLEEESREANAAKERAENADRQKSIFLANMSHEIRTPMNAIIGMTDLILRDDINDRVRANANDIKSAGDSLLAIINDVLDISKVESGKMEIASEEYDFKKLISDIISLVSTRIDKSKVELKVDLDLDLPNKLVGDEVRVKQIMINLLNNAAKFTEHGYIKLKIRGERDGIRCKLLVEVEDTGRGIRAEDQGKLFKTFARIENSENRYIEGTGLGLALCKKLVTAMGGDISVKSEFGKGSTFSFNLYQMIASKTTIRDDCLEGPAQSVLVITESETDTRKTRLVEALQQIGIPASACHDGSEVEKAMEKGAITHVFSYRRIYEKYADWLKGYNNPAIVLFAETDQRYDDLPEIGLIYDPIYSLSVDRVMHSENRGKRAVPTTRLSAPGAKVLVVDDNIINIKVVEGLLKCYDIECDSSESGADAIGKVQKNDYDIVFMDHMMPHMDGVEAMHRIRALGTRELAMPIIALTANAVSGVRNMFITEGFNDYISKPVNISRLESVLRRFLPQEVITVGETAPAETAHEKSEDKPSGKENRKNDILTEIDMERGLSNCSGNRDRYTELLDTFYKCADVQRNQIRKLYSSGNFRTLKVEAHALKSISASVGAVNLSLLAGVLEEALKTMNNADISRCYAQTMASFDLLVQQLGMYYNSKQEEHPSVVTQGKLGSEAIKQKMGLILEALDNYDDDSAKTYIDNLAGYELEPAIAGQLVAMRNHTELFDYESAKEAGAKILAAVGD